MDQKELIAELEAMEAVQTHMRGILTEVAYALKGPPAAGQRHTWADLPELAQKLATEHKHLKAWWAEHMDRVSQGYEKVAVDLEEVRRVAVAEGFRMGAAAAIERMEGRLKPLPEPDVIDPDEVA